MWPDRFHPDPLLPLWDNQHWSPKNEDQEWLMCTSQVLGAKRAPKGGQELCCPPTTWIKQKVPPANSQSVFQHKGLCLKGIQSHFPHEKKRPSICQILSAEWHQLRCSWFWFLGRALSSAWILVSRSCVWSCPLQLPGGFPTPIPVFVSMHNISAHVQL